MPTMLGGGPAVATGTEPGGAAVALAVSSMLGLAGGAEEEGAAGDLLEGEGLTASLTGDASGSSEEGEGHGIGVGHAN